MKKAKDEIENVAEFFIAFEAMREALRWMAENAVNMTRHPELYTAIDHHTKEARAALALADEVLGK